MPPIWHWGCTSCGHIQVWPPPPCNPTLACYQTTWFGYQRQAYRKPTYIWGRWYGLTLWGYSVWFAPLWSVISPVSVGDPRVALPVVSIWEMQMWRGPILSFFISRSLKITFWVFISSFSFLLCFSILYSHPFFFKCPSLLSVSLFSLPFFYWILFSHLFPCLFLSPFTSWPLFHFPSISFAFSVRLSQSLRIPLVRWKIDSSFLQLLHNGTNSQEDTSQIRNDKIGTKSNTIKYPPPKKKLHLDSQLFLFNSS